MRFYLDTNILAFLITDRRDEIDLNVGAIFDEYENTLLASHTAVCELIHLCQIGKILKGRRRLDAETVLGWCDENSICLVSTSVRHLETYASLPMYGDHRDPTDRMIIAQAISDRIPIVSSDGKFTRYEGCGLELVYNRR